MFKRIFLTVLDSVGIGEAEDAHKYGDYDVNTFGHTVEKTNVDLPNFKTYFNLTLFSFFFQTLHSFSPQTTYVLYHYWLKISR